MYTKQQRVAAGPPSDGNAPLEHVSCLPLINVTEWGGAMDSSGFSKVYKYQVAFFFFCGCLLFFAACVLGRAHSGRKFNVAPLYTRNVRRRLCNVTQGYATLT